MTDEESDKADRHYFEDGCLCIFRGHILTDPEDSDYTAVQRYWHECKCSRHPTYPGNLISPGEEVK